MPAKFLRILIVASAVAVTSLSSALAGPPEDAEPAKPPKEKPDFPKFKDAMKDFKEVPTSETPFFSLWYKKKSDALRAQIPAGLIGQQFMIATSMSGGPVATGFQFDHHLAYLERMDKRLVLMRVDPRHNDGGDNPVADVIKRSYGGDIILKAIPIVTMKDGDPIIDLDGLFKTDFAHIARFGGGTVDQKLSKWAKFKMFPENVELSVDLAVMRKGSGRRMLFHYSLSKIPAYSKGYKPRVADDRIGYFMTVRKDWSKAHDAHTLFDRYINRWRLEKRDPSLELSPPKQPITWYIEKTVPLKYRRWVKEGILDWNKAFEKCGFIDAIEVIQQEDYDARTKDLDPEDVRYNFFRWIVTGRSFAMGPSRAHPLTGQIFDADIVFDDSMVRTYVTRHGQLAPEEASWRPYDPIVEDFLRSNPQWAFRSPVRRLLPNVVLSEDPDAEFYRNLMRFAYERGRPICDCASGMAEQLDFARIALEAGGRGRDVDAFIGQVVKEIVTHEVGHCLGLRHNFKGSTWLPLKEIIEHDLADDPTVGSVMDYNPPLIAIRGDVQGSYITRSIGPWDYWVIEYGYQPVGKPFSSEEEMLAKTAARSAEAGLDYATDEDTMSFLSPDPLSNRFDMGRDVIDFAEQQIRLVDDLLQDVKKWGVKEGESYSRLRRAFTSILGQRARASRYVARFAGGQIIHRDHKGDPDARTPIQVVDPERQRKAVAFVCKNVFAEDAYQIDPELLSHLGAGRFGHWGSDDFDFIVDFNIHDFIAGSQFRCLVMLMNPFTVRRIHDNQVRFGPEGDVYTLAEHINKLNNAVWAELDDVDRPGTDREPFINSFRRNLQRSYLNLLLDMVLTKPGTTAPADASAIARHTVTRLSRKIARVLKLAEPDVTSRAHLLDVKKRIDKALDAEYAFAGRRGGLGFLFFRQANELPEEPVAVLPQE